jgi:hypothetical protein
MSFEPNNICPVLAAARAARLHKRIAAGDALVARLTRGLLEYCSQMETKGNSGAVERVRPAQVSGTMAPLCPREPMATKQTVADLAAFGRSGIGQDARRSRVGA